MKNKDQWKPKRFTRDSKGRIIGTHNHKIIGNAYEPVIKKYSSGQLADVGCGDVPYYLFYKDQVEDNTCIDWVNSKLDLSFIDHDADLNKPLDFLEDNKFDTTLCTDVLEHVHEPVQLFSEMVRITKPGGHLIITVPFLYWIHGDPYDYSRFTNHMLKEYCRKNNLEILHLEAFGGLPEVIFDLIMKGYNYYNLPFRKLFNSLFMKFGMMLSKISKVKNLSIASRKFFPQGYILVAKK